MKTNEIKQSAKRLPNKYFSDAIIKSDVLSQEDVYISIAIYPEKHNFQHTKMHYMKIFLKKFSISYVPESVLTLYGKTAILRDINRLLHIT